MEAAIYVASNLRQDDLRELVEGHGLDPMEAITEAASWPSTSYITMPKGEVAGVVGIQEDGSIWMLCTPIIHKYPIFFAREAKRFIDSRTEPLLHNIVDARNIAHVKLLRFLGFKFLRILPYGPNNLTFIEFCRCVPPPQQPQRQH